MMILNGNLRLAGFLALLTSKLIAWAKTPRQLLAVVVVYLVALVTSANIGSVATVIGNHRNMLIGLSSGIPFLAWCAALFPVAAVGLLFVWVVVALALDASIPIAALPHPESPGWHWPWPPLSPATSPSWARWPT